MLPLLIVAALHLRLNQAPELALYGPPTAIALGLSDLKDDLDTLAVEGVDVNPDALIEKPVEDLERLLVPLLLSEPVLLTPEALAAPMRVLLHCSCTHSENRWVMRVPSLLFFGHHRI